MRILAVGAHPDDIELYCGGTMAKYAKRGDELWFAYVTDGQMGHPEIPPDEISAIRKQEAQAACDVVGAKMIWLGFQDEYFFYNRETRDAMTDLIRQVRPDVVFGHYPDYFSGDHSAVGQQLNDAALVVNMPNLKTQHPHCDIPSVYFYDAPAGVGFVPDEFVDISDVIETKLEMVRCHESQSKWLQWAYGHDYIEQTTVTARYRGFQAGVQYAEGLKRPRKSASGNLTRRILP